MRGPSTQPTTRSARPPHYSITAAATPTRRDATRDAERYKSGLVLPAPATLPTSRRRASKSKASLAAVEFPLLRLPLPHIARSRLRVRPDPAATPTHRPISLPVMAAAKAAGAALVLALVLALVGANSEGDALSALRRSLRDPGGVLQSWDPTLVNPCTWFHVTCDRDNRVTRLDLGNLNLSGHLVPELGKLEHLQYLELYKNNIQGSIPSELGNLKNLISLDLYKNNISGTIPPTLGKLKSLVFLRLNGNRLTGPLPRELSGISSLKVVDVSSNDLCGTIPTSGPFEHIPLSNFEKNPRLEGPELQGLAVYDTNC